MSEFDEDYNDTSDISEPEAVIDDSADMDEGTDFDDIPESDEIPEDEEIPETEEIPEPDEIPEDEEIPEAGEEYPEAEEIPEIDENADECFGHGGDDMDTYDWAASYPESHFTETDEQYMYQESEDTSATNQRALRELEEFDRLQEEEEEANREWEAELSELEDIEYSAENLVDETDNALSKAETDEEREILKEESAEAHRKLDDARYNTGQHIRGM